MLCVFAGPVTEDVGLSALLFIGFVSQWWVLLILGTHPPTTPSAMCRRNFTPARCANAVHVVADQSYKLTKGVAKFLLVVYVAFVGVCALAVALKWRF